MMRMNLKLLSCTALVFTALIAGPAVAYGQDATSQAVAESTSDASTDQYIELLRKDLRSLKKQVIAANLDLTDKEAEKFWPIYDQYTVELAKINDTKAALIKDYAHNYSSMTDQQAEAYVKGRAAVDESVNRLRLRYFPTFHRVLSGKTAATFFQIEWRISLMIDLQLASQMPLIQP
jgi:Spy/CpxP family protein refolding chaperone